jgi:hypothetical protein
MGGPRAGDLLFHSLCGKKKALDVGGPSSIDFIYFWGSNKKQRSCDGGGAQRPDWGGNELKKTGARSARARTRGQNQLVNIIEGLSTLSLRNIGLFVFIFLPKLEIFGGFSLSRREALLK